jgi:hypothetical protein
MSNESNPPKQRGCFFYGCLSLAVLGLLFIVLGVVGYFVVKSTVARWTNDYTETTPALVEKVEYPRAKMDALRAQLAAFKGALDKGTNQMELVLTADDLNAFIAQEKGIQGKLFVRIDDRIKGELSLPLEDIGPLKLKGRYLNGTVTFKVVLAKGALDVRLDDVTVKGKPLPGMMLSELKKQNFAQNFQKDPKTAADIAKFESVQITNGTVILRNRAAAP